jgi:hypothetical protein
MKLLLQIAGGIQILLAITHAFFPKRFQWKEELSRLSLLNRQIFMVHTSFICFMLMMMGALSLFASQSLLQPTNLSRLVLGGFASFWFLRLLFQWFVYDWRLWKGHAFNTFIHFLFTVMWGYLASAYAIVFVSQMS